MDRMETSPAGGASKGFSLLEVLVAAGILGIMCAGVLAVIVQIDQSNRYLQNRTIAFRAAHQTMEVLLSDDMDLMLLQNGNTFAVNNPTGHPETGTITITDLNWIGPDKAYQIRLEVPNLGVVLTGARARS